MSNPLFPIFKKLELSDQKIISEHTEKFLPYSDFDFTSLWSYDVDEKVEFSWLNTNLVVRFSDYLTGDPIYSYLGNSQIKNTLGSLFDFLNNQGLEGELSLVPEDSVQPLLNSKNSEYRLQELADQNDYIIPLQESSELKNINDHKVEAYENFVKSNPGYKILEIDISSEKVREDILSLFDTWAKQRNKSGDDVRVERMAVFRLLKNHSLFNLTTLGLYIGNSLVGYIIDERVKKPFVIGHFIKANFNYPGVYEVLNRESAKKHLLEEYKYINIEQDLGIKGLRISKMQRSPVFFLKKYSVIKLAN